jgi:hypothetical protein
VPNEKCQALDRLDRLDRLDIVKPLGGGRVNSKVRKNETWAGPPNLVVRVHLPTLWGQECSVGPLLSHSLRQLRPRILAVPGFKGDMKGAIKEVVA